MARLIFGGLIAVILLALYAYSMAVSIQMTLCIVHGPCSPDSKELNEGIMTVLNLVGGLVSALVVAELAVTPPGDAPSGRSLSIDVPAATKKVRTIITFIYILVWVICGVAALYIGYLKYPNVVPALTNAAKSWLGLAVAAAYSYLGVQQRQQGGG